MSENIENIESTAVDLSEVSMRPIEEVTPYPNNPRIISEDAVQAVAESIQRYGWQQPIVTDENGVIVVGHTRRQAALSLGLTHVPVQVMTGSSEQVDGYRLVDNKTSEFAQWDDKRLAIELREFDDDMLDKYFPEVDLDLEIQQIEAGVHSVTEQDMQRATDKVESVSEGSPLLRLTTVVECPACAKHFDVQTRTLPGATESLMRELVQNADEK